MFVSKKTKINQGVGQINSLLLITLGLLYLGGLFLFLGSQFKSQPVQADIGDSYGVDWALATDSFGWFSLNCQESNCSNEFKYWVNVPEDGGAIRGWAWSEYAGWVCFGIDCEPSYIGHSRNYANYNKTDYSSEIEGWANILVLGEDGWVSLRGGGSIKPPEPYDYRPCSDCFLDEGELRCRICYTDSTWNGSGSICSDCVSCTEEEALDEGHSCTQCISCQQYGLAYQRDVKKITGWAWNSNWQWNLGGWVDTGGQPGAGWLQFNSKFSTTGPPWLQTKQGDVYAGGRIVGGENTPPDNGQSFNATYLIHANGTITNFTSEQGIDWVNDDFDDLVLPTEETRYFGTLGRIDLTGIEKGYYGEVKYCESLDLATCSGSADSLNIILGGKIYIFEGNYNINDIMMITNNQLQKGNGLILVKGNLYLNTNITYSDKTLSKLNNLASLGWLVVNNPEIPNTGRIIISPAVTRLAGTFYAENNIDTCLAGSADCSQQLKVNGSMISQRFHFGRTYTSIIEGAEVITDNGRALVNTPPGMQDLIKALPVWQQTSP